MVRTAILGAVTLAVSLGGHRWLPASDPSPDPISGWSVAASSASVASGMAPLRTPITLAILHVAMYDAVVAVTGDHQPYAVKLRAAEPASTHAAATEAGYRVLLTEFPDQQVKLQGTYEKLLTAEPASEATRNGIAAGAEVARRVLAIRAADGRNAVVPYVPDSGPGAWIPTPPETLPVTTAFLARVTPFTLENVAQFRPAGPPPLGSKKWVSDFDEVKAFGAKDGSSRTPEQTATARFWEPLAGTVWPITIRRLAREQTLDLAGSARFQAAAFAAFADGLIACWEAKFHFNYWRPITAIRHAALDGNARTTPAPEWEPLAVTPNFPEYPSGHTCATAAVAHTIQNFFPRDVLIPARNVVTGEERLYRRAADVVDEVVEARILLGLHFRTADEDGAEIGRQIAQQISDKWFGRR